jgi:hypothetical protein
MALATTINWANAKLISHSKGKRNLRDAGESFYNVLEVTESKTEQLYAMTKTAVETEVGTATQPDDPGGGAKATYTYQADLDGREVNGYTIKRIYEYKAITFEEA